MASKIATTSQFILDKVGGAENVTSLTHCATRLRFQLADQTKADQEALHSNGEVLGVVPQGSTGLQVVMGGAVANYYQEIIKLPGMENASGENQKKNSGKKEYGGVRGKYGWVDYSFEFLSDTFRPILWALLGASLIITILVLLDTFHVQDFRADPTEQKPIYQFMHAMYRSVFYFLPVMVGATAARKLGANEWVGAAIPAALLTPDFLAMKQMSETVLSINSVDKEIAQIDVAGIPMYISDYGGQVFPPMLAAIALYWLEKGLKRIIPSAVQMVFVPFFCLLVLIPATAFILGPFGIGVGNGISNVLTAINDFSPFILSIIIPLIYPFLVPLGLHWPLNAIMIQNIVTNGYDIIQGPMGAWNFACFGVVTGVLVVSWKERNQQMRQVAMGGMMAGLLGGISEPSLYGVLLRFRKTYIRLLPGCFLGGVVMGLFSIKAKAFVFTSLLTIPAMEPAIGYIIGIAIAFTTSFLLVMFFDYRSAEEKAEALAQIAKEDDDEKSDDDVLGDVAEPAAAEAAPTATVAKNGSGMAVATKPMKAALESGAVTEIVSPLEGKAVALSDVPDPIFAGGRLGEGVAIQPTGNIVVAPAAAKVIMVQKSGHAIALRLDSGIELLIHVGLDTVQLEGEGFEVHVTRNQEVEAGEKLITFDHDVVNKAGFPLITPVVVSNTKKFESVEGLPADEVTNDTVIITTTAKY